MNVKWSELLNEAVSQPGLLHQSYQRFHNYSIGNAVLILWQCMERQIEPGPVATYKRWQELGRQVRGGEKAMVMWMPITVKEKELDKDGNEVERKKMVFVTPARWFVIAQTEGEFEPVPETVGDWSMTRMLSALEIKTETFEEIDGNCMGYAKRDRTIAVSPLAFAPIKTAIHEAAHVIMHFGKDEAVDVIVDAKDLTYSEREVEAESVALLVCDALGLDGQEYSRGYIQRWLGHNAADGIPEKSARRIFSAAERILKAGREASETPSTATVEVEAEIPVPATV
jgi:antirestriction protein ArdC